ncbi:type IA DNA topoisomerase [Virgibacillus sp. Bac330]|uniref:type IA DNA topoisomerase n=1 Tax=Virgibacillus sp. Bac330 TaxID=2419841 RepID=UPI000EF53BD3|nr:type IA DNA topoisomerase [Virgibacillus sp. Bac330]
MGCVLILAEKPSQGKAYGDVFQNVSKRDGYLEVQDSRFFNGEKAYITWGFGHLVELVPPEAYNQSWKKWDLNKLPIMPETFQFQVAKDKQKQFQVVKRLCNQVKGIIIATDSDREGENIARSILQQAGANHKPIKRLWINSLEVEEIEKGLQRLQDGNNYIALYKEAQTRQYSDWLVGMNASRLYTLLLQKKGLQGVFSVGRVQTPTLYLIYKRQEEIANFTSQPFFELAGNVTVHEQSFEAKHNQRYDTKQKAMDILQSHGIQEGEQDGKVKELDKAQKKTRAPKLHSLSTLQTKMNKQRKYSPSMVLKIVQGLYEKKLVTYPRTDCHFITENEFAYVKQNLTAYQESLGISFSVKYPAARKAYVDSSKVQEHYAIIPTKQVPHLERLTEKERDVYREILATTLAMFAPDYEYEETKVIIDVRGLSFYKTGKVEKNRGWKVLFAQEKQQKQKEQPAQLPAMKQGDACMVDVFIKEGKTQPPKPYTEGNLIQVMKHAGKDVEDEEAKHILKQKEGIGTEATRASIIETLKHQQYIEIKKNVVYVTSKGKILCQAVDGTLLASPEMTAKWETYLAKIGRKEGSQDKFVANIKKFVTYLLEQAPHQVATLKSEINQVSEQSYVGDCPMCQTGKLQDKGEFYGCSGYQEGCTFSLPKTMLTKKLPQTAVQSLLKGKRTNLIKGFKSKKGKKFDAYLTLDLEGKITFEFPKRAMKKR